MGRGVTDDDTTSKSYLEKTLLPLMRCIYDIATHTLATFPFSDDKKFTNDKQAMNSMSTPSAWEQYLPLGNASARQTSTKLNNVTCKVVNFLEQLYDGTLDTIVLEMVRLQKTTALQAGFRTRSSPPKGSSTPVRS